MVILTLLATLPSSLPLLFLLSSFSLSLPSRRFVLLVLLFPFRLIPEYDTLSNISQIPDIFRGGISAVLGAIVLFSVAKYIH